ncbi:MAG: RimK family alpha-L-glutamate ligase [Candidatus Moraniibacteriota bacterium]|jgi:glutathione synthase/RimK-type ligase-like ATP-grasp enzyme
MKKVLILFGEKDWNGPAFADMTSGYTLCYEYLYELANQHGIQLYRASYKWYDNKNNIFLYVWTYKNGSWIRDYNIKPDLIYDKTSSKSETDLFKSSLNEIFPLINDVEFTNLIDNKLFTSLLFPQHTKKHYKALNITDLKSILQSIKTEKVVLKTSSDSGGKNVYILQKNEIDNVELPFPILAQEFIDSTNGITGITDSVHDLRLVFIENDLIYSYIRIPKKGSFLANLSQGGSMKILQNEQLPTSVNTLVTDVQNTLSTFKNKIYTIDLMFDENQKPWLIELNSMPGLFFTEKQFEERERVYTAIIELFKKTLSS